MLVRDLTSYWFPPQADVIPISRGSNCAWLRCLSPTHQRAVRFCILQESLRRQLQVSQHLHGERVRHRYWKEDTMLQKTGIGLWRHILGTSSLPWCLYFIRLRYFWISSNSEVKPMILNVCICSGAAISESRQIESPKFAEMKRQALFIRSTPEFYKTDVIGNSSASSGAVKVHQSGARGGRKDDVFVTLLRNPETNASFYIARHKDSTAS